MSAVYLSAMGNLFYEINQTNTQPIPDPPINNVSVFIPTNPPPPPDIEFVAAYDRQIFQNAFLPNKNYLYTNGVGTLGPGNSLEISNGTPVFHTLRSYTI